MKKIASIAIAALIATSSITAAETAPPAGGLGGLTPAQGIALGVAGLIVIGVATDSGSH